MMASAAGSPPRQSLLATFLASLLVGMAALCAAVIAVGLRLSSPQPAVLGAPPTELGTAEAVSFPSGSGSMLHGWWVGGRRGSGVVVLMPGIWSNRSTMVRRAQALNAVGASVLLFDFQAEGESPGERITFGYLESRDAAAAIAFAQARAPGEPIGIIGVSLGGAAAVLGPRPLPVQGLVLESVYPTIGSALENRLRVGLGPIAGTVLAPLLSPLFQVLLPGMLHVSPTDLRPIDHIGSATAPVLIASGTKDDRTPLRDARALYERAPGPKQFWPVNGAAHVDLERFAPEEYWRVVLPFLARAMKVDWAREVRTARD